MSKNKLHQTPLAATIAKGQMQAPTDLSSSELLTQASDTRLEPRDGSTLHYATLRMNPDARAKLLCTISLTNAVSSSLIGVQDAPVAQTKLQWWNDEIGRLAHDEPRHPDTKRCAAWLGNSASSQSLLTDILDAATAERFDAPTDDDGWSELVRRDYSARLNLAHKALSNNNPPNMEALAESAAWIDILRTLPSRMHHDQVAFPASLYKRFDSSREHLQKLIRVEGRSAANQENPIDGGMSALIQAAVLEAITATDAALESDAYQTLRSESDTRALSIWFQLRRAQLMLWKNESPNLLRETMTLTPLKKWFIAFRFR